MPGLFVTTPIYYVNSSPHIGHVYTSVMADIYRRARASMGDHAVLSTGTDEHGQKNEEAARREGIPTREFLDRQSRLFREIADRYCVGYDCWVRTTSPEHGRVVETALSRIHEGNLVKRKSYSGLYCAGCEQFKKATDLDESGNCRDHKVPPAPFVEENYFVALEPHRQWLRQWITENPAWIQPEQYRSEVMRMLDEPLDDLCISRPRSRVGLGIALPFDEEFVAYVWYDALLNYLGNAGWPAARYGELWDGAEHVIGKDILKPHCVYWPMMLRMLGVAMPRHVWVHAYWITEAGDKMSKSLGNALDPSTLLREYGVDAVRYYLAKHARFASDSPISSELIRATYHSDLSNNFGNLYSRVMALVERHLGGRMQAGALRVAAGRSEALAGRLHALISSLRPHQTGELVELAIEIATRTNAFFNDSRPWELKHSEDRAKLESVLAECIEGIRLVFVALHPIMPGTAARVLESLGTDRDADTVDLKRLPNLFPRLA